MAAACLTFLLTAGAGEARQAGRQPRLRPSDGAPTASPSPVPQAYRLTSGGCCSDPFWTPDSSQVVFIDRPDPEAPAGLYAVPAEGGTPRLVTRTIGLLSRDWRWTAFSYSGQTIVQRLEDRAQWVIPNQGRAIRFSPSGRSIAWQEAPVSVRNPDLRERTIWTASPNGLGAQRLITVLGGSLIGWTTGEEAILVSGRLALDGPSAIWRVSVFDGSVEMIHEVRNPRDPLLSPQGGWLAYYVALSADEGENGLWLLRVGDGKLRRLSLFGSYRWRREGSLLVIPLDLEAPGAQLWEVDAASGRTRALTDPLLTPLAIANNDWQPSPDGSKIVLLSSEDYNLWILPLP